MYCSPLLKKKQGENLSRKSTWMPISIKESGGDPDTSTDRDFFSGIYGGEKKNDVQLLKIEDKIGEMWGGMIIW